MSDESTVEMTEELDATSTTDKTTETKSDKSDAKMYPESYVKKIHSENAARRKREEDLEKQVKEYQEKELAAETDKDKKIESLDKRNKQIEKEFGDKLSAAERRYVTSEAKRLAREAGIIDPDDVKTAIDFSDLRVDDDDTVVGLAEKIAALKSAKPHWFKTESSETKTETKSKTVTTPDRKETTTTNSLDWSKGDQKEFTKKMSDTFGIAV